MKLGEWLKNYRMQNKMTLQDLSRVCGFSKSYINALERGINPTTGKPFSPTIKVFEKIARGTGYDLDSLLKILDGDQSVKLNPKQIILSEEETLLLDGYRDLNDESKQLVQGIIYKLREIPAKQKKLNSSIKDSQWRPNITQNNHHNSGGTNIFSVTAK